MDDSLGEIIVDGLTYVLIVGMIVGGMVAGLMLPLRYRMQDRAQLYDLLR